MRLTILINGSDPAVNHEFALVWIDLDQKRWSRESHEGVDLPSWGDVRAGGDETVLCAPQTDAPLCIMRGLSLNERQEVHSGHGDASWPDNSACRETAWQWRLQAVDRKSVRAANSLFAC
ncbi:MULTISPECIES: DUF3564 family protein [Paraburkholderia]|uniref:DUF3564 family protein n=1 Tax=Paraburkholderia guartelaensis TaxID=2546446 RepID=A0ABU9SIL0_9BURK